MRLLPKEFHRVKSGPSRMGRANVHVCHRGFGFGGASIVFLHRRMSTTASTAAPNQDHR